MTLNHEQSSSYYQDVSKNSKIKWTMNKQVTQKPQMQRRV